MTSHNDGFEMSLRQRAMVDTCFEEGQYESAISVLEQLRSPTYKPSVSHVRQLIYIALHPIFDGQPEKPNKSICDSPSKLQQFSKTLSPAAINAARQLLFSFAATQAPNILARALPCYDIPGGGRGVIEDVGDSDISRECLCINEARDCWSVLVEGFISKGKVLFSTPRRKSRRRDSAEDDIRRIDDEPASKRDIVGESAWPLLDWILTLFERDELLTMSEQNSRYSSLLLSQIPPNCNSMGNRWDIEVPLSIVMFCFQQSDSRKQRMGARLVNLLINLSFAQFLDFPMFIASVFGGFSTAPPESFQLLLSAILPSLSGHQFKVALCYKFINEAEPGSGKKEAISRLKPTARARKPHSKTEKPAQSQTRSTAAVTAGAYKHLPPCEAIFFVLKKKIPPTVSRVLHLRVKFELFSSYSIIQKTIPEVDRDLHWTNAVQHAKLQDVIDAAFSSENGEEATKLRILAQGVLFSLANMDCES